MSKPRILWQRLRTCWRLLTQRGWLVYLVDGRRDGRTHFQVAYTGLTTADAGHLRHFLKQRSREAEAGHELLDTLHNLNPGIAPAAE